MKKIYLIDWNSFIYRMFFALPEFSTKDWIIVNALFWMAKFFVWQITKENPDYVCFITDAKWDNFRHQIYADYKANRDRMPDNLRSQISLIEEMVQKMWFKIITIPNCEADDVIWTLATSLWQDQNNDIYILSWDKDLYSLTKSNVKIYDTMKQKIFDYELAKTKFDVNPEFIIDYLAIVWDASDNIPGVAWFWPKKAVDLINTYWTVEQIFEHIDDDDFILKSKTLEKLKEGREMAFLSKRLATIDLNIDLDNFNLNDYIFDKDKLLNEELKEFFRKYEFNSLIWETIKKDLKTFQDLNLKTIFIQNKDDLDKLLSKIKTLPKIFFQLKTTSTIPHNAKIAWVSILLNDDEIYYINFNHNWEKVETQNLKDFLKTLFSLEIEIIWYNLKYDLEVLKLFLNDDIIISSNSKNSQNNQISLEF